MNQIPSNLEIDIYKYLNPNDLWDINQDARKIANEKIDIQNKKLKQSALIINRYVNKYYKEYVELQNTELYDINHYVYKKFYPMIYRNSFIKTVFDKKIINEENEDLKGLTIVDKFNKVIEQLSIPDLHNLGW